MRAIAQSAEVTAARIRRLAAALLLGAAPAAAQAPVAFVDVNLVPMDSERVVPRQTVLVDGGRITRVGPVGETAVPPGVRVIDGAGAYLLPGLADMHVHLAADSNELALYVANGVTTVRDLSGEPGYFAWRRDIAEGRRAGPNLVVSSPLIDAPSGRRATAWLWTVTTAIGLVLWLAVWAAARRISRSRLRWSLLALGVVAAAAAGFGLTRCWIPFPDRIMHAGPIPHWWVGSPREAAAAVHGAGGEYDLVKLYERLLPAQFAAAVRAAREAGLHSVAHVPAAMGLERTLQSGLDELAHIYFLVVELQASTDTSPNQSSELREEAYRRRLREIVAAVRRSGIAVTSTMMPMPELLEQWTDSVAFVARDDMKYRPPATRRAVREQLRDGAEAAAMRDVEMHITWGSVAALELVQAGVPLVLGTDNAPFTAVAGFGAHEELRMLVAAGLTPFQALRTATVNASRVAGDSSRWGTVAAGRRADLILATGNPLADPGTLRRPRGVMVAGRWYDRAALDSLLEAVVRRRAGS